jgi:hypothetical protein
MRRIMKGFGRKSYLKVDKKRIIPDFISTDLRDLA